MNTNFNKAVEMVQFKREVLEKNVVVVCHTLDEAITFLAWAHSMGKTWVGGDSYVEENHFESTLGKIGYSLYEGIYSAMGKLSNFMTGAYVKLTYEESILTGSTTMTTVLPTQHKKVVFNDAATVVIWNDDTKTIVKCTEGDYDKFDQEKGYLMAYFQRNTGMSKTQCAKFMKAL